MSGGRVTTTGAQAYTGQLTLGADATTSGGLSGSAVTLSTTSPFDIRRNCFAANVNSQAFRIASGSPVVLQNNVFVDNPSGAIYRSATGTTTLYHNTFVDNQNPDGPLQATVEVPAGAVVTSKETIGGSGFTFCNTR